MTFRHKFLWADGDFDVVKPSAVPRAAVPFPKGPAYSLARMYARLFARLEASGQPVPEAEVAAADAELEGSGWHLEHGDGGWRVVHDDDLEEGGEAGPARYAAERMLAELEDPAARKELAALLDTQGVSAAGAEEAMREVLQQLLALRGGQ